jgi:hypothetical protein
MATSSSSNASAWTARALIFSGRADPEWQLADADVAHFMSLWNTLAPTVGAERDESRLGYRGCVVANGRGADWHMYDGVVVETTAGRRLAKQDIDRALERVILESAPPGLLPPHLIG